jgi:hypothetical protein
LKWTPAQFKMDTCKNLKWTPAKFEMDTCKI